MNRFVFYFFALLCVLIGLYPAIYFFVGNDFGLKVHKPDVLLNDIYWNAAFYLHIVFGGIALLIGWMQFPAKFRRKHIRWHRRIGLSYLFAVVTSGLAAIYLSFMPTGGWITGLGFFSLAIEWLSTTIASYFAISKNMIQRHRELMIYSYAACFGAVTLRLWLPILIIIFGEFLPAYRIVAWLAWVPNIIVAAFINHIKS